MRILAHLLLALALATAAMGQNLTQPLKNGKLTGTLDLSAVSNKATVISDLSATLGHLAANDTSTITLGNITLNVASLGSTPLNANNLSSGTIPDLRFPSTLPALSGVNLTALNATNIGSGTVAAARLPASLQSANALSGNGYPAFLSGTWVNRTLLASGAGITVSGGNGSSDPTVSLHDNLKAIASTPLDIRINVLHYGAVGDGVANDTTAVQAAITAAVAAHATVLFPSGVYKVNLTLPSTIALEGPTESSVAASDAGHAVLVPQNSALPVISVPDAEGVVIRNFLVRGPGAYVSGSTGIRVAAATPGVLNVFGGLSTIITGCQVVGFEANYFIASYRVLIDQCAGREGRWNFYLANPASGVASDTPGAGYVSDHIVLRNVIAAGARQVSAGVYETTGSRTSYAIFARDVRSLHVIGGDIGQLGTGLHLESCAGSFQGLLEACDVVGLHDIDSDFAVMTATLNSGGMLLEGAAKLALGPCTPSGSYAGGPAFVGIKGGNAALQSASPITVKYMDSGGTLLGYGLSSGARLSVVRTADQAVGAGEADVLRNLAFNARESGDGVETGANSNFDTGTGLWTCPRGGRYRFAGQCRFSAVATYVYGILRQYAADGTAVSNDWRVLSEPTTATYATYLWAITIECVAGKKYGLAVASNTASAWSILAGGSPVAGTIDTRMALEFVGP